MKWPFDLKTQLVVVLSAASVAFVQWVPDGQLASAGRVDPDSQEYPRTNCGLDQVSADWPKTMVHAGETITIDFFATAPHDPSVCC